MFLIVGAIAICINTNLSANDVDITFTEDGVIQDGDDYDDVFVYGDTTTVNMTGGEVAIFRAYNQSTINITGGWSPMLRVTTRAQSTLVVG